MLNVYIMGGKNDSCGVMKWERLVLSSIPSAVTKAN
jgi:hypothetical protein